MGKIIPYDIMLISSSFFFLWALPPLFRYKRVNESGWCGKGASIKFWETGENNKLLDLPSCAIHPKRKDERVRLGIGTLRTHQHIQLAIPDWFASLCRVMNSALRCLYSDANGIGNSIYIAAAADSISSWISSFLNFLPSWDVIVCSGPRMLFFLLISMMYFCRMEEIMHRVGYVYMRIIHSACSYIYRRVYSRL